jgi:hypothetical protein
MPKAPGVPRLSLWAPQQSRMPIGEHIRMDSNCQLRTWAPSMCRSSLLGLVLVGLSNAACAHSDVAHQVRPDVISSASVGPEAMRLELAKLQAENERLREHTRLRDVLGGLGLLAGIFGVGYYVAARRARRQAR